MPGAARSFEELVARYEPVIGLEVHAQLLTRTKLFCACANPFGAPPNTLVCPVCLGLPGALPVLNRHAVTLALRAALATACTVHSVSVFERKSYFYPDLPKGYQTSQYARPPATGGSLALTGAGGPERCVRLARIHMEEDAGKLLHEGFAWSADRSGVDLDRGDDVAALARTLDIRFTRGTGGDDPIRTWLGIDDVSEAIRSEECGSAASRVAAHPAVRTGLLEQQRAFRRAPGLVADGRDMGTVVFPDAEAQDISDRLGGSACPKAV